jgi:hypothetical protein
MSLTLKSYIRRCWALQHLGWGAFCAEVEALGYVFDALPKDDQAAIMTRDLVAEYAAEQTRKARYRRLTRPGPLSGPNPFARLRQHIRSPFIGHER